MEQLHQERILEMETVSLSSPVSYLEPPTTAHEPFKICDRKVNKMSET